MRRFSLISEIVTAILVGLSGLAAALIALIDLTGLHVSDKAPQDIVMGILGIIGFSIGVERITVFIWLRTRIDLVEELAERRIAYEIIQGKAAIYGSALAEISTANRSIRVLAYGSSPKTPVWFAQDLAKRLEDARDAGEALSYSIVIAVSHENANKDLADNIERRLKIFEEHGVRDLVHPSIIVTNELLEMEAFIIDEKSAQLSFSIVKARGVTNLQFAIFFRNQPDLCRDLAAWFDNKIQPAAESFLTWRKRL